MYKMTGRIRYSECGVDNKIEIASIINYFQDCTTENSERLGVGHAYLKAHNRAWLLNSWQVFIRRRPQVGEEIVVTTWATGFHGVFGPRDFSMTTVDGEELVCAHSLWVYVDTKDGRPIKPTEKEIAVYEVGDPIPIATFSRKIKLPEGMTKVDTFPVHKYHIDTNNHVNNSKYVELACEVLPDEFEASALRVEYKKAAVYGDSLVLKVGFSENHTMACLCDEEEKPYAIVEFIGEAE